MAQPRTPAKQYPIEIGDETVSLRFGNLAIIAIEQNWGSLNGFLREFSKGDEGQFLRCMSTIVVSGLAYTGFRLEDIDRWDRDAFQDALGAVAEAFAESFGLTKDESAKDEAPAGEAAAADEAA